MSAEAHVVGKQSPSRGLIAPVVLAVVIACAGVVVGVIGISKASSARKDIRRLEGQVRLLTAHTGGQAATVTSRVSSLETKVGSLEALGEKFSSINGSVHGITSCLPELQSEVDGLGITDFEGSGGGEHPTLYGPISITNHQNISKACSKVLYGY